MWDPRRAGRRWSPGSAATWAKAAHSPLAAALVPLCTGCPPLSTLKACPESPCHTKTGTTPFSPVPSPWGLSVLGHWNTEEGIGGLEGRRVLPFQRPAAACAPSSRFRFWGSDLSFHHPFLPLALLPAWLKDTCDPVSTRASRTTSHLKPLHLVPSVESLLHTSSHSHRFQDQGVNVPKFKPRLGVGWGLGGAAGVAPRLCWSARP